MDSLMMWLPYATKFRTFSQSTKCTKVNCARKFLRLQQVSCKQMSHGCHGKHNDHPKYSTNGYGDRVERQKSCKLASLHGHRTQLLAEPCIGLVSPVDLRFRDKQASTPDLDVDCESCVALDSPLELLFWDLNQDKGRQGMPVSSKGQ